MTEVIDNFLPEVYFSQIEETLLGEKFPWYWNSYVNTPDEDVKHGQFIHGFFHYLQDDPWNSSYCDLIEEFIHSFRWKEMLRVKANLIPRTASRIVSGYHIDDLNPHKVGILYINTNNGYTLFENGDRIDCVRNRMLFFDGSQRHSSVTCTDENTRVVINLNYR